jgi:hypothetical protein
MSGAMRSMSVQRAEGDVGELLEADAEDGLARRHEALVAVDVTRG